MESFVATALKNANAMKLKLLHHILKITGHLAESGAVARSITASNEGIAKMMASLGLDPTMQDRACRYGDLARGAAEAACEAYMAHIGNSVAEMRPVVAEHGSAIIAAEIDHVTLLFSGAFADAYVSSLNDGAAQPFAEMMGARARLGTAVRMIDPLFREAAKRNRFSSRRTADDCLAIAKLVLADCLAASVCHQKAARTSLSERRQELEAQSTIFRDDIATLSDILITSAERLKQNSFTNVANSLTADERAAAAEDAASHCAEIVEETSQVSASFADALAWVERETNRTAEITNQAVEGAQVVSNVIQTLVDASEQIESVVSLIADIAKQTNLLALNATIEAARAGIVGKGFAVVAAEVKALSLQTGKAASEIAWQISNMQKVTNASVEQVKAIGETIQRLKTSGELIKETVRQQAAGTLAVSRQSASAAQHSQSGFAAASEARAAIGRVVSMATDVDDAVIDLERAAGDVGRAADRFVAVLRRR